MCSKITDLAVARGNLAKVPGFFAQAFERSQRRCHFRRVHDHNHAHAAIERAAHFVRRDVAVLGKPVECRPLLPAGRIDARMDPLRQRARQILGDTAPGYVRQPLDCHRFHQFENAANVNTSRLEQRFGCRSPVDGRLGRNIEHFANQRIAIGMRAARCDADQSVAGSNATAIYHCGPLNRAHAKSREIVFPVTVHIRHLRGLAPDQCCAGLMATFCDSGYDIAGDVDVETPAGKIIEEKQRLGALHKHVVHAHCNQVDTDSVVALQVLREHEFGTDPVGPGDEHRLAVLIGWQSEQAAESAQAGKDFRPVRALDERLDSIDQCIAGVDIDSGIFIGQRLHRRYNSAWASTGKPLLLKSLWAMLVLAIVASPAWAVEVASLYTAQVPLDQEEADPRSRASEMALVDVLRRVSGSDLSTDPAMIELLFPDPSIYVVQYVRGDDDTLLVSFDGGAIEEVLRAAGQTVWGSDRPLTLVWLAVDWGQGQRQIIGADDPQRRRDQARSINRNRLLRQRVLDIAERRGLPVVFPLLDTVDLQNISFSDIWGGFDEALIAASERYDADSILVGRIRATSNQRNRWSYYFGDEEQTWSGEPELVLGLVADQLAEEFAIRGDALQASVELTISGIDSVQAFGAVQNLLSGIAMIESFSIAGVEGDRIRYRVVALGGADRLSRALRFNGLAELDRFDSDSFGGDPLDRKMEFFYSP